MTISVTPYAGATHAIRTGGAAQPAVYNDCLGAEVKNPLTATDQGIGAAEPLYLSFFGNALLKANSGTIALQPGESFTVPAGVANDLTANAVTSGHKFSVFIVQPAAQKAQPQAGAFPPNATTCKTTTIASYLYQQYNDDDDIAAFFAAYNEMVQVYVDTFNALNLPVYTADAISGLLLDWVGNGLYGYPRPVISAGYQRFLGPLNTFAPNELEPNEQKMIVNQSPVIANDDIYKRSITWHFLKGDGKVFNVRWLKRRIMRWLTGTNGAPTNPDQTYQISVTFGVGNQVTIEILHSRTQQTGGALPNWLMPNQDVPNESQVAITQLVGMEHAQEWKEAAETGLLELPFQFQYTIVV